MHSLEAESGQQAIERLESEQVDVLILDLMMDNRDGFEVLRYLSNRRLDVLAIVVSTRREEHDKIATLGLGAEG